MSREKENQTLTSRLAESQDAVCQLKQLVEEHVASEREKNKRVSDNLVATAVLITVIGYDAHTVHCSIIIYFLTVIFSYTVSFSMC